MLKDTIAWTFLLHSYNRLCALVFIVVDIKELLSEKRSKYCCSCIHFQMKNNFSIEVHHFMRNNRVLKMQEVGEYGLLPKLE